MQRLVTIYLDNGSHTRGMFGDPTKSHGVVEEHLGAEIEAGWRIAQIAGFGGNSDGVSVRGWVIVVLEK